MEIVESLLKNNIKHVIYENNIGETTIIKKAKIVGIDCIPILDARSAVYYGTGISAQNNEKVAVCISSVNSSSAFSGMTEAFYRKLPILLFTLGSALNYSEELGDVTASHYVVTENTMIDEIIENECPMHIEVHDFKYDFKTIECDNLMEVLSKVLEADSYLSIGQYVHGNMHGFLCKTVKSGIYNSVDGALSNVLGASLANIRNRYIGLVSEMEFLHDMNALGNVNINDRILFIVVTEKKNETICNYAKSLSFSVSCINEKEITEKLLKSVVNNGKKSVFMVWGDI